MRWAPGTTRRGARGTARRRTIEGAAYTRREERAQPLIYHELDDFREPWAPPAAVELLHPSLGVNADPFRPWLSFLADRHRVLRLDARQRWQQPEGVA